MSLYKLLLGACLQFQTADIILNALADSVKTREELKEICRQNTMTETEENCMFDPWGGGIRELCERGFINYTVKEKKEYCLSPEFTPMLKHESEIELARRYFTNFGPATIHDAQYFFIYTIYTSYSLNYTCWIIWNIIIKNSSSTV